MDQDSPKNQFCMGFPGESVGRKSEGERVQPYLSRIKTAAVKVELKRRGRCNEQSHPGAQVQLPCPEAKKWAEEDGDD